MEFKHVSVLLDECIEGLDIKSGGIYVDATAGGAGHSSEIAKALVGTGQLIALDKDPTAVMIAGERLSVFDNARVIETDFKNIKEALWNIDIKEVDGILVDLGVSSHQLDTADRGFSYNFDAKLDMRMSKKGLSAYDVVNEYSYGELCQILTRYGEEKFAKRIVQRIVDRRAEKPIETTFELVEIIKDGIPAAARREGGHPAKRTFQAIRIEVNKELEALEQFLDDSFELLKVGGRLAVITFHSLEDRMVKQRFTKFCEGCTCPPSFPVCVCGKTPKGKLVNRKPIVASEEELEHNNRSRSAKLRIIERIGY